MMSCQKTQYLGADLIEGCPVLGAWLSSNPPRRSEGEVWELHRHRGALFASFGGKMIDPRVVTHSFLRGSVAHILTKGGKKTPPAEPPSVKAAN